MIDFSLPNLTDRWDDWPDFYPALTYVSAFDHWLNEQEFVAAPFVDYHTAREDDVLEQYYPVEEAFLALYERLIGPNVVLFERVRFTSTVRKDKLKRFKGFGSQVRKLIRRNIREERGGGDIYIPHLRLRVLFNWWLTHAFFFEDGAFVGPVMQMIAESGVHALPSEAPKPKSERNLPFKFNAQRLSASVSMTEMIVNDDMSGKG